MRSHTESPVTGPPPEAGDWGPRDWCASGATGPTFAQPPSTAQPFGTAEPPSTGGRPSTRGTPPPEPEPERGPVPREKGGEPADPAAQARAICLRLLTGSPRTRRQLADALRRRGIPDEAAEEVLSRFEDVGLIDDAAFADAWVESRHTGRGLARRALARELRSRGVSGAVVDEAVGRLDPEQEAETARTLVDRKLRATRGLDRQVRIRRLAGMLARRGYPEGVALRVVREALAAEGEDEEELEHWLPDG